MDQNQKTKPSFTPASAKATADKKVSASDKSAADKSEGKQLGSVSKSIIGFLGLILAVFALYIIGSAVWQIYSQWSGTKRVERLAEALKQQEEQKYQAALADTYGGKTPQETLQMYISAVEKGDYELASKYFIKEKQEGELKSFENAGGTTEEVIRNYIAKLKEALIKGGQYDKEKKYFSFNGPILINLTLYPSGVWKIIEI